MTRQRPTPRQRGVLAVIAALLVGSGLLRLGESGVVGAGLALATGATEESEGEVFGACDGAAPTDAMLEAFRLREERIATREAQMADRAQALALAESEIEEKLAALEEAEASLAATLAIADGAAEADLARLTAVYENMKPEDAAGLFERMDAEFAAGFLARMEPGAAAAVLSSLEPETAYSFSVVIAGRNALAPTE